MTVRNTVFKAVSLLFVFFLAGSPLWAMPPHPSKLAAIKQQGPAALRKLSTRLNGMLLRGMDRPKRTFPTTGNRKVLVLLVQYSDSAMNGASTAAFYSNLFNGATPDALSWRKYYQDMSNGALNLTFDVKGPYTAANTLSYYGANDGDGYDVKPATLVGEAIDAAETAGTDFTQYDNDNDGEVDVVIVIHAGVGEESSQSAPADAIWSHAWDLDSGNSYGDGSGARTYDGKKINEYAIQPEFVSTAGDSTIGVFCHEFGHVLGLPDMYDTSYATGGVGDFSLMAGGSWLGPNGQGGQPAPLLAWEKKQLGWITLKAPDGTTVSAAPVRPAVMLAQKSASVVPVLYLGFGLTAGLLLLGKKTRKGSVFIIPMLILFLSVPFSTLLISCSDDDTPASSEASSSSSVSSSGTTSSTSSVSSSGTASSSSSVSSSGTASSSSAAPLTVSVQDIETGYTAIKIPLGDPAGQQYLLIENKQKVSGTWTQYLPGSGLLITHIHDGVTAAYLDSNAVNDGAARIHGVNIVEADNNNELWTANGSGESTDLFSGRSFNSTTAPKPFYYTGTASTWSTSGKVDSTVQINNISASGATMTFDYSN